SSRSGEQLRRIEAGRSADFGFLQRRGGLELVSLDRLLTSLAWQSFCYHGTCLPDNMPASGPPSRRFLSRRSQNAPVPSPRSAGSAVCRRIRGSFRFPFG